MNLKGIGEEKGTAHRVKILPRLNARHTLCDMGWDFDWGVGRRVRMVRKERQERRHFLPPFFILFSLQLPHRGFVQVEEIESKMGMQEVA